MMVRQRIKQSMQQVDAMLRDVCYAEKWLEGWIKVHWPSRNL